MKLSARWIKTVQMEVLVSLLQTEPGFMVIMRLVGYSLGVDTLSGSAQVRGTRWGGFVWSVNMTDVSCPVLDCLIAGFSVYCSLFTQVHLSNQPEAYNPGPGYKTSGYINKNLFFDKTKAHLYITTEKKVRGCHLS